LVDLGLATTNLPRERLIPIASDHWNICHLSAESTVFREIKSLVKGAISSHPGRRLESEFSYPSVTEWGSPDSDSGLGLIYPGPSPDIRRIVAKQPASAMWSNAATFGATTMDKKEIIPMLTDFPITRREPKLPVFRVPHKQNSVFWGRNDVLEKLDSIILRNNEARDYRCTEGTSCAVMTGLGGVGKTQLALHYAHSRRKHFDAVFWIRADESTRLAREFALLSVDLELDSPGERDDPAVSRNRVLGWLAGTERPWLLVFDNADDVDVLNDYWPMSNNGAIIVTSRDPLAYTQFYQASGIVVGPFSTEDASSFLRYLTNEHDNINIEDLEDLRIEETRRIATSVGGLPLAITHVAAVIDRRDLSYGEFLQIYDMNLSGIENFNLHGPQTLSTVFSFERLRSDSKKLLDILSFLEPDRISESLLQPNVSTYPNAAIFAERIMYQEARTELIRSSLITRNGKTGELSIHRVVQDIVRSKMSTAEASKMFGISVSLLKASWPQLVDPFISLPAPNPEAEAIVSHILKVKALYEQPGGFVLSPDLITVRRFAEVLQQGGW
jgi:hypothetical protein